MKLTVQLYGTFRKYGDGNRLEVELAPGSGIPELRAELARRLQSIHPEFTDAPLLADSAFANETRILGREERLEAGATLAVLPPVCGG